MSQSSRCIIIWDFQNVRIPYELNSGLVSQAIKSKVQELQFSVLDVVVVTDVEKDNKSQLNSLQDHGVSIVHVKSNAKDNAADFKIKQMMTTYTKLLRPNDCLALISSDKDFRLDLTAVQNLGTLKTLLIYDKKMVSKTYHETMSSILTYVYEFSEILFKYYNQSDGDGSTVYWVPRLSKQAVSLKQHSAPKKQTKRKLKRNALTDSSDEIKLSSDSDTLIPDKHITCTWYLTMFGFKEKINADVLAKYIVIYCKSITKSERVVVNVVSAGLRPHIEIEFSQLEHAKHAYNGLVQRYDTSIVKGPFFRMNGQTRKIIDQVSAEVMNSTHLFPFQHCNNPRY